MTKHLLTFSFGVIFLLISLALILLGGCSSTTSTSTTYYYPNWMPDGRIIAFKEEMTLTKNLWGVGVSSTKNYVIALTINANSVLTKEENLFEVSERGKEITCSPVGDMIAYIKNVASTRDVVITDFNGNVKYTPGISADYLDWSPTADRLAYSNSSNLYVVNVDGSSPTQIATSAEAVAWRVGDKIAYESDDNGSIYISVVGNDGSNIQQLHGGQFPQNTDAASILFRTAGNIKSIKIDGTDYKELFPNYERSTLKLSYDNTKIVGGDLVTGGGSNIAGIWVTNISDGQSTKLK